MIGSRAGHRRASGASLNAMAQSPPLTLIFHGKTRHSSEGQERADSTSDSWCPPTDKPSMTAGESDIQIQLAWHFFP